RRGRRGPRAAHGHPLRRRGRVTDVLIIVRSILFNVLFYLSLLLYFIAALPTFFMPYRAIIEFAKVWARTNLWLLKAICGIDVKFSGVENIPPGPLIVRANHHAISEPWPLLP